MMLEAADDGLLERIPHRGPYVDATSVGKRHERDLIAKSAD